MPLPTVAQTGAPVAPKGPVQRFFSSVSDYFNAFRSNSAALNKALDQAAAERAALAKYVPIPVETAEQRFTRYLAEAARAQIRLDSSAARNIVLPPFEFAMLSQSVEKARQQGLAIGYGKEIFSNFFSAELQKATGNAAVKAATVTGDAPVDLARQVAKTVSPPPVARPPPATLASTASVKTLAAPPPIEVPSILKNIPVESSADGLQAAAAAVQKQVASADAAVTAAADSAGVAASGFGARAAIASERVKLKAPSVRSAPLLGAAPPPWAHAELQKTISRTASNGGGAENEFYIKGRDGVDRVPGRTRVPPKGTDPLPPPGGLTDVVTELQPAPANLTLVDEAPSLLPPKPAGLPVRPPADLPPLPPGKPDIDGLTLRRFSSRRPAPIPPKPGPVLPSPVANIVNPMRPPSGDLVLRQAAEGTGIKGAAGVAGKVKVPPKITISKLLVGIGAIVSIVFAALQIQEILHAPPPAISC
jgi:hypothetical protein